MALVTDAGGPPAPKKDVEPKIESSHYASNLLDRKEWVGVGITTQLDGSPWGIEAYFQQVLGGGQAPQAPQPNQPDVYQQYRKINDYELMVTSSLNPSQNTDTGEFEVTGDANIYPGFIPNQGDVIVASGPDGRKSWFVVKLPRRLTTYNRSAYSIEYMQMGFYDAAMAEFFQTRTVEELYYRKDYLRVGKYPFLTTTEYVSHGEIRDIRSDLIDRMNRQFYHPRLLGFPIPGEVGLTYDPFLTEAWRDMVQYTRDYQEKRFTLHNVMGSTVDRAITLWDVLLKRARWIPDLITREAARVSVKDMTAKASLYSIRHTYYEYVLVPAEQSSFPGANGMFDPVNAEVEDCGCETDPNAPAPPPAAYPSDDPPIMNPVDADESYILSDAFYAGFVSNMSVVERQVHNALEDNPMDLKELYRINDAIPTLPEKERYYCTVLLYCLLSLYEWR